MSYFNYEGKKVFAGYPNAIAANISPWSYCNLLKESQAKYISHIHNDPMPKEVAFNKIFCIAAPTD